MRLHYESLYLSILDPTNVSPVSQMLQIGQPIIQQVNLKHYSTLPY